MLIKQRCEIYSFIRVLMLWSEAIEMLEVLVWNNTRMKKDEIRYTIVNENCLAEFWPDSKRHFVLKKIEHGLNVTTKCFPVLAPLARARGSRKYCHNIAVGSETREPAASVVCLLFHGRPMWVIENGVRTGMWRYRLLTLTE